MRLPDGAVRRFGSGPPVAIEIHDARFFRRARDAREARARRVVHGGRVGRRRPRRLLRAPAPQRRRAARRHPIRAPPPRVAPAPEPAERLPRRQAEYRLPLRPRQRALRALPRRDDDVLLRGLRAGRRAARGRPAAQVPPHLREAPPRPDDHVLEIGCGWGGFAPFAAGEYGARVTGLTISPAQAALARDPYRRPRRPGRDPRAGLPHARGQVHEDRVDRDARGDRRAAVPDLLRDLRPAARAGRHAPASRRSSSPTSATTATGRRRTGSSATSSPAA